MADLHTAIERLRQFRMTFNEGDLVDEGTGLTADDLTAVVAHATAFDGIVPPGISRSNPLWK